jgi:predicted transcriptional regulator
MRVSIDLPDPLIERLRDLAAQAHRPPRYQLEWLVMQALQDDVPEDSYACEPTEGCQQ